MKRGKTPYLSLIIPAYNEQSRLLSGISSALSHLTRQQFSWELIIVDDGSSTHVKTVLEKAFKTGVFPGNMHALPISIYRLPINSGKGAALRLGVAKARGDVIVFSDVDFSVPLSYLSSLMRSVKKYPVAIASRRLPKSVIVTHQSRQREISGRIFTALSNIICGLKVADATCGFKGFQRNAAKTLFAKSRIDRWVFDTEILFLARKEGWEIKEIAVAWTHRSGSKVKVGDTVQSFIDLWRIKILDLMHVYEKTP